MSNHIAFDPHVVLQHVDAHARAMAARNSGYVTAVLRADLHPDQWPDGVPLRVAVGLDGRRQVWLEGTDLLIAEQPAGPVLPGAGRPASPTLVDRLARWLDAELAAGRMPAKASARPALQAGRCSGVLVSLAGQRRAGRTVPASAAHRTGCALVLAPVLAAFLARMQTRHQAGRARRMRFPKCSGRWCRSARCQASRTPQAMPPLPVSAALPHGVRSRSAWRCQAWAGWRFTGWTWRALGWRCDAPGLQPPAPPGRFSLPAPLRWAAWRGSRP